MQDTKIERPLFFPHANAQNSQYLVFFFFTGTSTLSGGVSFKFVLETIIYHCYVMLVKSFI